MEPKHHNVVGYAGTLIGTSSHEPLLASNPTFTPDGSRGFPCLLGLAWTGRSRRRSYCRSYGKGAASPSRTKKKRRVLREPRGTGTIEWPPWLRRVRATREGTDGRREEHGERLRGLFPAFSPLPHPAESFEARLYGNVLGESFASWMRLPKEDRNEPKLSEKIGESIQEAIKGTTLKIHTDPSTGGRGRSRVDPLVCESSRPSSVVDGTAGRPASARLLVEVGIHNEAWWKKFDQGMMYVTGMDHFVEPMLFAVVTLQANDADGATRLDTTRVGVFLLTPTGRRSEKGEAECRISLLWNKETPDMRVLSDAFGRMLYASTTLLPPWIEASDRMKEREEHVYLGPNCCKVGDKVR
jgi:hypothetical protein